MKIYKSALFVSVIAVSVFLTGCDWGSGGGEKELVLKTSAGTHTYQVEIADTKEQRSNGLKYRTELGEDDGMFFIYEEEEGMAFWMPPEMEISLDLIFFDKDMKVTDFYENLPICATEEGCPRYSPKTLSKYALEVNPGIAAKIDLQKGDIAELK
jgi:uncharacterized protein